MTLTTHDIGLQTLDGLADLDALCLFVAEDERPLRGTAGYVDWRLCGALSRVLQEGFFTGSSGERLLLPSAGRIAMSKIFALGLGPSSALDLNSMSQLFGETARLLARAQIGAVALEIPGQGTLDDTDRSAALLHGFLPEFKGRVAVLSDKGVARLLSVAINGSSGRFA
jgi:hypothetical protein